MIDCVLLTEGLVVTVEGKRTEPLSLSRPVEMWTTYAG